MSDDKHYSDVEIEDLLSNLSKVERIRLTRSLIQLGPERIGWTSEDLLQHTFADLLNGQRNWPMDVKPRSFIHNAARSILDNQINKRKHELSAHHVTVEDNETFEADLQVKGILSTVEKTGRVEGVTEAVESVIDLFTQDGDSDVLCLIRHMLENASKKKILIKCELTESMYNAARSKLKYRARKYFPNGIKFWEIAS